MQITMKYSGLYFISNPSGQPADASNTASTLISSLETHFHTISRSSTWALTYRLFRDTQPRSDPSETPTSYAHTYQHFLTHSSLSHSRAYILVAPPTGDGIVTEIPANQSEAQALLLRNQLATLWTSRQTLSVQNGATYTGGLFTVEIGELRMLREAQGSGFSSPGVVICIKTVAGQEDSEAAPNGVQNGDVEPVELDFAQSTIRDFWKRIREGQDLGRGEVREVFMIPKAEGERESEEATVRMWCEGLRLRG